jgi:hypothetical protein
MHRAVDEWLKDVWATKWRVAFWVPHTTLEKKVKCANNPNHKPNVPLVIEEKPHFAPFFRTVLPHIWGDLHFFLPRHFSSQDVFLSSVQDVIDYFISQRS